MDEQLAIMAKFWQPGRVMTRLAVTIGQEEAAAVQREFLRTLLIRCAGVADRRVVVFTPADREARFRHLAAGAGVAERWEFEPQGPGDLGARMAGCYARAFRRGAVRVALLGADSPNLPTRRIAEAFQCLRQRQVVLGPTPDGGYYLVAARAETPPIFADIPWGSGGVLDATIARLQEAGCSFRVLEPWYDVDRFDDLIRLRHDLPETPGKSDPLAALAAAVDRAIRHASG